MTFRTPARAAVLLAYGLILVLGRTLLADGFIYVDPAFIPFPPPPSPPPPRIRPVPRPEFPLRVTRHRVEVRLEDGVGRTRVEETFFNPNAFQLEGTYLFPMPPGASISRFAMSIGGKEVPGEVLERDKARTIYESIVRQSRDPGLLEFVDRGVFRARVFPIPAQGNVEVKIDYEETLPLTGGMGRYRYPLNTGKYSAGPYENVLIDLTLKTSAPLRSVSIPSHQASISRPSDREARVVFETKSMNADRDFLLDWNVGEDALAPLLLTKRTHEPDGFFLLSISPRPERPKSPPPKDLVAVIDTSGSMVGPKMDEARRALRHFVNALNPADRFNIVDFSTEARRFREGLVEAGEEGRRQALSYIDGLEARGGTNIEESLRLALDALDSGGSDERFKLVVLITDGEPTVGIIRPEDILRSVRERNPRSRRVFCFGVGVDLNAQLLERLAQDNRGSLDYVMPSENIEVKLSSFWDKIDFPVLTDLRIEFPNLTVTEVYPRPLPDLFRGEQLTVLGRFRDAGRHPVLLRGKFQGEERVFEYTLDFDPPAVSGANDLVPRQWATRKIGYLLEAIRVSGRPESPSKELKEEVIRLSQQYGILTPYTSYLILEEGDRRLAAPGVVTAPAARGALRDALSAAQPLPGAPAGAAAPPAEREAAQRANEEVRLARKSLGAEKGDAGVAGGRAVEGLKLGESKSVEHFYGLINKSENRVKQVGSRAFYLQGDRWVEGGLEEKDLASARKISYLSDEYFTLLTKSPGIGELLGVGPKVSFRFGGETLAIQ